MSVPSGNYMIESADSKGKFLTVENMNISLHSEDSHSVQVWKLAVSGGNWVKFQGVPPDAKKGKFICADIPTYTLVYSDDSALQDFQLENDANDTYRAALRVTFEYYEQGLYWQIVNEKSLSLTNNLTYAARWKLTQCSK
ncbi:hypothetical protein DEU56DRAFT_909092 [Suillus clintonianus]|uniref:uncharacterized protein n=1 Tax=Suillus clintonianus TaxID=1904413 RepID=UPI001B86412C|nr:uncharacterized protein DEU56DRAFT_909092 [Suillus clintonianus]KAG2148778.1 hypothetical protein DEU56DRAFT_909092 [Suillus clintonianus]